MGDHRPVLADFTQASVLGINLPKIEHPAARRLTSKVSRICNRYITDLERLVEKAKIFERLQAIEKNATDELSAEAAEALEKIDRKLTSLMLKAEKGCRKLYKNHYEFSLPVKLWLDRCHL